MHNVCSAPLVIDHLITNSSTERVSLGYYVLLKATVTILL